MTGDQNIVTVFSHIYHVEPVLVVCQAPAGPRRQDLHSCCAVVKLLLAQVSSREPSLEGNTSSRCQPVLLNHSLRLGQGWGLRLPSQASIEVRCEWMSQVRACGNGSCQISLLPKWSNHCDWSRSIYLESEIRIQFFLLVLSSPSLPWNRTESWASLTWGRWQSPPPQPLMVGSLASPVSC